jgi:hypothetical protein
MSSFDFDAVFRKRQLDCELLVSRERQLMRDVDELRSLLLAESEATSRLETRADALRKRVDALERVRQERRSSLDDTSAADVAVAVVEPLDVPANVRPFFVEHCTRVAAVQILADKPPLSFLLRRSSFGNAHALSFVDDSGDVIHCLVQQNEDGAWLLEGEPDVHASLMALLVQNGFVYE